LIFNPSTVSRVIELIKPSSFYKQAHKLIYTSILELFNKNEAIDVITVSEDLNTKDQLEKVGGRAYINDLAFDVISTANIEYHAGIIAEKASLRELIKAGNDISELAYNETDSINVINAAEKLLFNIVSNNTTSELMHIKDFSIDIYNDIQFNYDNKDKQIIGISSGFYDLDNYTGGFQPSDLIIIAGRPAMERLHLL